MNPWYSETTPCYHPGCTGATKALVLENLHDADFAAVVWCEHGHVTVRDQDRIQEIYEFGNLTSEEHPPHA